MIVRSSSPTLKPLLFVVLLFGVALFVTGLAARWPTAFRTIDLDLAETCRIWARLGGTASVVPDALVPIGRSLLAGSVIAIHQGLDVVTNVSRCQALGPASLVPLGPLGFVVFLFCLVPIVSTAGAAYVLTGSRRTAALAAALALMMERFSASLSDGSYGWIPPGALIALATYLLMAAGLRGRFAPAFGAGMMTMAGMAMLGQAEVAATLAGGLIIIGVGVVVLLRSPAAGRLSIGLGLGLLMSGAGGVVLSQRVYGVPFLHTPFEMTRTQNRLAPLVPSTLGDVGPKDRSDALLLATMAELTASPLRFAITRAKDAVTTSWALGKWLLLACLLYLPVTFRVARARGLLRVWTAALLPVALLFVDSIVGSGRSFAALALLIPLVVLPVMVWRDL